MEGATELSTGSSDAGAGFEADLEAIESAYEFMLAYAAQGRDSDEGAATSPSIREVLHKLLEALPRVAGNLASTGCGDAANKLAGVIGEDARRAAISVQAALDCSRISSQLVDNLNASIHLRAVLTGLFLVDEIVRIARA
jgi:hypothetical protein